MKPSAYHRTAGTFVVRSSSTARPLKRSSDCVRRASSERRSTLRFHDRRERSGCICAKRSIRGVPATRPRTPARWSRSSVSHIVPQIRAVHGVESMTPRRCDEHNKQAAGCCADLVVPGQVEDTVQLDPSPRAPGSLHSNLRDPAADSLISS